MVISGLRQINTKITIKFIFKEQYLYIIAQYMPICQVFLGRNN